MSRSTGRASCHKSDAFEPGDSLMPIPRTICPALLPLTYRGRRDRIPEFVTEDDRARRRPGAPHEVSHETLTETTIRAVYREDDWSDPEHRQSKSVETRSPAPR